MQPLILQGGVDVSPTYYTPYRHHRTQRENRHRDEEEFKETREAMHEGRPIIGICRGAQLLCIANGGSLYQHTPNHNEVHEVETKDGHKFFPAADHHQVMNPRGEYEVLAWDSREECTLVHTNEGVPALIKHIPECIYWPKTKSLGVQWHPEWMGRKDKANVWFANLVKELFNYDYFG